MADRKRRPPHSAYVFYPPLPRRTRIRLWLAHQVNTTGIWLVNHGHYRAALWFWRIVRIG